MHGDCVTCGFPILVEDTKNPVECPFCATVNQPVSSGVSFSSIALLVAVVTAVALGKGEKHG